MRRRVRLRSLVDEKLVHTHNQIAKITVKNNLKSHYNECPNSNHFCPHSTDVVINTVTLHSLDSNTQLNMMH